MNSDPLVALFESAFTDNGWTGSADLVEALMDLEVEVSEQTVRMWRRGGNKPRDDIRPRVAEALGVDLDTFLRACAGIPGNLSTTDST